MSNPADPSFNHYSLTDLFAITEELEFEGDYISPPEPDLTAYAEAINKVAHQAAVDSNYHPHKIDAVIHKVEVNAYYHNLVVRGLIAMAGGIQPEADPLVAPQGQGLWPQIDAEITARINAIYPGSIPYGEFDLAERFIRSRGDEFRYCEKDWRYFKGVGWIDDAEAELNQAVMLHCKRERVRGQYDDPPLPLPRLLQIESGAMVNKIVSLAESSRYTKAEQWDADPLLLGTPGGVVDLRTGEFHPGRRDLIVMRTVVDPIPLPPAGCLDDHCPEFAAFLDWATQGDLDLINYLQRAAGYTLSGDFSEQCLFFLLGKPNSGKGTWTRILSGILGSKYAKVADRRVFSQAKPGYERHSTEVAALKGARMATFQETKEVYTWDTEKIKAMTGGDDMTARLIAKNNTDFKPTFKFWFASNNDPVVRRGDGAMQRRLRIIPFNAQFSKGADTQLDGKLKREFGMILTWMINGALAWQQTRTMSGGTGLAEPQVVTDAVKELFEQGDALDDWIDACCCVTGASLQAEKGRLYESWKAYAEPLGELKQYPSATAMGKGLELRGYKRGKATGSRRSQYTGIQPK